MPDKAGQALLRNLHRYLTAGVIDIIYRNHLMLHPTDLTAQPWGDLASEVKIGSYQFMTAAERKE